jgi:hypothetical protein
MNYWFVNQGTSYEEEKNGGFIYAPKIGKNGASFQHWINVKLVKKGDIIFCNKKGNILSVARAISDGYESVIPASINGLWAPHGYKADLEYQELKNPLHFSDYKEEYMRNIDTDKNPFTVDGSAKMGYLFPMEYRIAEILLKKINDNAVFEFVNMEASAFFEEAEETQEENEQFEEISSGLLKSYTKEELELKENEKYEYIPRIEEGKAKVLREKTDGKLKATRMELASHNCEINPDHKTFTNSSGKFQYLECHHIIPLKAQKNFPNIKLDSMFNIIALCPICHMQVHHANKEEKKEIFLKMYNIRKEEMIEHGFDLAKIGEIFDKYYLNNK